MNRWCAIAVILGALVLGCAPGQPKLSEHPESTSTEAPTGATAELVTLEVGGMTCQGCVAKIEKQLEQVPGVHRVEVSLDRQRARLLVDKSVRDTALTGAVRRAGPEFLGIVVQR